MQIIVWSCMSSHVVVNALLPGRHCVIVWFHDHQCYKQHMLPSSSCGFYLYKLGSFQPHCHHAYNGGNIVWTVLVLWTLCLLMVKWCALWKPLVNNNVSIINRTVYIVWWVLLDFSDCRYIIGHMCTYITQTRECDM